MANVTMAIDQQLLDKARKVALQKKSSVNALVRGYLQELTRKEDQEIEKKIKAFRAAVKKYSVNVGPITWKREDLYDC